MGYFYKIFWNYDVSFRSKTVYNNSLGQALRSKDDSFDIFDKTKLTRSKVSWLTRSLRLREPYGQPFLDFIWECKDWYFGNDKEWD